MEQIERIEEMERCLDASEKAIRELSEALTAFEDAQPQYRKLSTTTAATFGGRTLRTTRRGSSRRS